MPEAFLAACDRWMRERDFARVVQAADELLHRPLDRTRRAEVLYRKAVAVARGFPDRRGNAIACLREAADLAQASPPLQAEVLVSLCGTYAYVADHHSVRQYLRRYQALCRSHAVRDVLRWSGVAWYNYALALDSATRHPEAERAYRKAIHFYSIYPDSDPALRRQAESYHNLSGIYIHLGRLPAARAAMDRAAALLPYAECGPKIEDRRAEYALAAGDPDGALLHVVSGLEHPAADDESRAELYYTWARVDVMTGRSWAALQRAQTAIDIEARVRHVRVLHEANRLLQTLLAEGVAP